MLFARRLVAQGQVSAPEPAEERAVGETHGGRAARSPMVPLGAVVPGSDARRAGSELDRTDGAVVRRERGRGSVLLTDSNQILMEGPKQNSFRGTLLSFLYIGTFFLFFLESSCVCCFVCTYTLKISTEKSSCTVFWCHICYLLRALLTMITHCVSLCVF